MTATTAATPTAPVLNPAACEKLITLVWNWDHMKMFHEAVTDAIVPGYSAVITDPIDLTTMRQKLAGSSSSGAVVSSSSTATSTYTCDTDVLNDIDLMITNALKFNPAGTIWHNHAKTLRKRLRAEFVPMSGVVVDEEEIEYVDKGSKKESTDYSKSMRKEEKKKTEDVKAVLSGMEADLSIPIEELRKRFAAASAAKSGAGKKRAREGEDEGKQKDGEGSDDSGSSSSSGSSGSGSSSSSGSYSSDDGEEDEESDEENSSVDS